MTKQIKKYHGKMTAMGEGWQLKTNLILSDRFVITLRWLTTVLMEYKSTTFNFFEKGSKLFFPSLFTVCLSLLPFYVKCE